MVRFKRPAILLGGLLGGVLPAGCVMAADATELSVLTYNIEGLPWPARAGRNADLTRIADRLRQLRASGQQPHVVLFEEAFSHRARAIAADAGYRFVADGPTVSDAGAKPQSVADRAFLAAARFLKGEKLGKWRGSGLRIASDYPIVDVKRLTYPAYACAGMDCLANKGAVLVTVAVPGVAQPVAIVDTHLNSRRAARVSADRSFYAYRRQVDALSEFVSANVRPGTPLIVAGDFNAGQEVRRRDYLLLQAAAWHGDARVQDALGTCLQAGDLCPTSGRDDLAFSQKRGRDYQLFAAGGTTDLRLKSMAALFGHDASGHMLSDHVGYAATYLIGDMAAPVVVAERVPVRLPEVIAVR